MKDLELEVQLAEKLYEELGLEVDKDYYEMIINNLFS